MKKKKILAWVATIALLVIIHGCAKDVTVIIPLNQEVTTTVSFSNDIVPIFTSDCALGGCHGAGGHVPVLTPELAYNSLISGAYIDTIAPEKSTIYLQLTGKLTPAMPIGRPSNPSNIEGLILAWVEQGAKNN